MSLEGRGVTRRQPLQSSRAETDSGVKTENRQQSHCDGSHIASQRPVFLSVCHFLLPFTQMKSLLLFGASFALCILRASGQKLGAEGDELFCIVFSFLFSAQCENVCGVPGLDFIVTRFGVCGFITGTDEAEEALLALGCPAYDFQCNYRDVVDGTTFFTDKICGFCVVEDPTPEPSPEPTGAPVTSPPTGTPVTSPPTGAPVTSPPTGAPVTSPPTNSPTIISLLAPNPTDPAILANSQGAAGNNDSSSLSTRASIATMAGTLLSFALMLFG